MRYYKLDISKAEVLPSWMPDGLRNIDIICQTGMYGCDIDIVSNSIPIDLLLETRDAINEAGEYPQDKKDYLYSIPLGFNLNKMPVGATITAIEKPEWIISLRPKMAEEGASE